MRRRSLAAMLERIEALSTVHRRLYQSKDVSRFDVADFARDLVADLLSASGSDVRSEMDLQPVIISAEKATPVALMINELVTNSLKHAFTEKPDGTREGKIGVKMSRLDGHFNIEVSDDGVGMADGGSDGNFGMRLVRSLARQLHADVDWRDAGPGTRVVVRLPAETQQDRGCRGDGPAEGTDRRGRGAAGDGAGNARRGCRPQRRRLGDFVGRGQERWSTMSRPTSPCRHPSHGWTDRVDVARYIREQRSSMVVFMTANPKRIPEHFSGRGRRHCQTLHDERSDVGSALSAGGRAPPASGFGPPHRLHPVSRFRVRMGQAGRVAYGRRGRFRSGVSDIRAAGYDGTNSRNFLQPVEQ